MRTPSAAILRKSTYRIYPGWKSRRTEQACKNSRSICKKTAASGAVDGTDCRCADGYKDKVIYVFSYYDKEDYFLDYITEIDDAIQGYTKVIIGDKNQFKFNLDKFYPINPIENLDEMSFLGGQPEYLQQESYDFLEKYIFIGQILGMDLPEKVNEIFYLTENIGYIFINRDLFGGLFFVQTT